VKVLYCINNLRIGGAQKVAAQLALEIGRKENWTADVLFLTEDNQPESPRSSYNFRSLYRIWKCMRKGNYDLVHAHLFPVQLWVAMAGFAMGGKRPRLATTEHNTQNRRRKIRALRGLDRWMYRQFDLVFAVSQTVCDNLLAWLEPPLDCRKKFLVVENGVDLERFYTASPYMREEMGLSLQKSDKLICMASRFVPAKDQETLIRTIKLLPENVHLLLAGDGPLKDACIRVAEQEQVSNRVHFLGFRNDMDRLLKSMDVVVLSSHWEGFSLAAIEAMASGTPLVASDVEGLGDIVGGAGLLFKEGDSEALALQVGRLLQDSGLYAQTSLQCRKRAEKFDVDRTVRLHRAAYESLFTNGCAGKEGM
jgi:glycosyltransferase involved in cell wall biosynthesis